MEQINAVGYDFMIISLSRQSPFQERIKGK